MTGFDFSEQGKRLGQALALESSARIQAGVAIDELCDALFWISEYPNRVLPHEGQQEHAVELAEHARDALSLHDEKNAAALKDAAS